MSNPFDALDEPLAGVNPFDALDETAPTVNPFDALDAAAPNAGAPDRLRGKALALMPVRTAEEDAKLEKRLAPERAGTWAGQAWRRGKAGLRNIGLDLAETMFGWIPGAGDRLREAADLERGLNQREVAVNAPPEDRGLLRKLVELPIESLPVGLPAIAGGAIGGVVGGLPGAMVGAGLGSAGSEYSSSVDDYLARQGVNFEDPDAIRAAYDSPELMAAARAHAGRRGAVVGTLDAATLRFSGGTTGALLRAGRPVAGAAAGLGIEATGGAAGEALAQVASEGRVSDWGAVGDEAIGELGPGSVEVLSTLRSSRRAANGSVSNAGPARGGVSPAAGSAPGIPEGAGPAPSSSVDPWEAAGGDVGALDPFADLEGVAASRSADDFGERNQAAAAVPGNGMPAPDMFSDLEGEAVSRAADDAAARAAASGGNVVAPVKSPSSAPASQAGPGGVGKGVPGQVSTPVSQPGQKKPSTKAGDIQKEISDALSKRMGFPIHDGAKIEIRRVNRNGDEKLLRAKVVQVVDENTLRVEYLGLSNKMKKVKLPTIINLDNVLEPRQAAGNRRRAAFLRDLPKEERRRVAEEAREFNRLLLMDEEMFDQRTSSGVQESERNPGIAGKKQHFLLVQARNSAAKVLGLPADVDMANPVEQARALPLLKAYYEAKQRDAGGTPPPAAPVTGPVEVDAFHATPTPEGTPLRANPQNGLLWFTSSPEFAEKMKGKVPGKTWRTVAQKVRMERPLDLRHRGAWIQGAEFEEVLREAGLDVTLPDRDLNDYRPVSAFWQYDNGTLAAAARAAGYDGVVLRDHAITSPMEADSYIVLGEADPALSLEALTEEGLAAQRAAEAEQARRRAEQEEIARRQGAPMQGSGRQQSLDTPGLGLDLEGQQDMFESPPPRAPENPYGDLPPPPEGGDENLPFSGGIGGYNQQESQPGAPAAGAGTPPPPPAAPVRGMDEVRVPFAGPEFLRLWRQAGGRIPKVFRRLAGGRASGFFRGDPTGATTGEIGFAAEVGELLSRAEKRDLYDQALAEAMAEDAAAQAGGAAAKTKEQLAQRAAELYEPREKAAIEWARVNRGQEQFAKVFGHEVGHWDDYMDDRTFARGNILGRVGKSLVPYMKSMLAEHPALGVMPLTKKELAQIRRKAEQTVGPRPSKKDAAALAQWRRAVRAEYRTLLDQTAASLGLVRIKDVVAETDALIKWWRGTNNLSAYNRKPEERFADMISVFMLAPGQFEARAPKTFYVLDQWIKTHKPFYDIYQEFQKRIAAGEHHADRVAARREMFARADEKKALLDRLRSEISWDDVRDSVAVLFDRVRGPVYRRMRELKRNDPERYRRVREAIKADVYQSSKAAGLVAEVNTFAREALGAKGWAWEDFGEYVFHRRVIGERAQMLNPGAEDSKTSLTRLEQWKAEVGPQKWADMEAAYARWQDMHKMVLDGLDNQGVIDPDLMAYMLNNESYATFHVVRDDALPKSGSIDEMLLTATVPTPGSAIYKQRGTLQDIQNPATATLEKWLALQAYVDKAVAKREVVEMLNDYFPDQVKQAKVVWVDGRPQVVRREGSRVGTLIFKRDGRDVGYHVPKGVADAFSRGPDGAAGLFLQGARTVSSTLQALHTAWNPIFWPTGFLKDVSGSIARTPGMRWFGDKGITRHLARAYKSAWSLHFGNPDDLARAALRRQMLQGVRDSSLAREADVGIDRLMREFGQNPMGAPLPRDARGILARFNRMGQTFEHAVKIAGMTWHDEHAANLSEPAKRQRVRVNVGSPEFMDRGQYSGVLNLFMPFFNASKQGWIAQVQAGEAFDSKLAYAGKLAAYSLGPRLAIRALQGAMVYAAYSALKGKDKDEDIEKERQAMWAAIPQRDRLLYLCVPVGWYDRKANKVAYLRIPQDETSALIGGMFETAAFDRNNLPGTSDVMAFASSRFAPGDNNILGLASDWLNYYLRGRVNLDGFTGRPIITDLQDKAGGTEALAALTKHSYNQMPEFFRMLASSLPGLPGRFDLTDRPEQQRGLLENFLRVPGASRFFRVSNAGMYDTARTAQAGVDRTRARELLAMQRAAARLVDGKGQPGEDVQKILRADKGNAQYFRERVKEYRAGRADPLGKVVDSAGSKRAKAAVSAALEQQGLR